MSEQKRGNMDTARYSCSVNTTDACLPETSPEVSRWPLQCKQEVSQLSNLFAWQVHIAMY